MSKLVFSCDTLPAGLDDRTRFDLWQDIYLGTICHFDVQRLPDRPFSMRYEFAAFGDVGLARCEGTVDRITRTQRHIASDPRADFFLSFNGTRPWLIAARGRETEIAPGAAAFLTNSEPAKAEHIGGSSWTGIMVPRARLEQVLLNPDDLTGTALNSDSEPLRYLKRYLSMLFDSDVGDDSGLTAQIETTLLDLLALVLGTNRDASELAKLRGLRAARLQTILTEIAQGFTRPDFSTHAVAAKLGFSANYVHKLLHHTGQSFGERVLELRLHKARAMLSHRSYSRLKVSDIALACGFNDISNFNRSFRRRFGASPTQFRGNGNGSA